MRQTSNMAIVLRYANYRDNDRMLTLLSPTKGKLEVLSRGCRRPKSPLVAASELFALGDFELYEKSGRQTVTGVTLTETFYALREDYDRLTVGIYLLNMVEAVTQPGVNAQELFMLLLHTLSRLTFTDQPWKPLLSGFLLHFASCEGFRPRLAHCVHCGREIPANVNAWFDSREGGLCCGECHRQGMTAVAGAQIQWMRKALQSGSASWLDEADCYAPFSMLREFVEGRLDRPVKCGALLPKEP